ncbi:ABC transporter permease [Desulfonema ishimotonii]|uniref:ABC transporter permease n=1 Tax=Desulfonema ishimotonii TaxID=45657 RepID=A0A401G018_9BACT|nr:ABC transporter permease [Desulfonema ishimotonii]GBC62582.1 ABC transporter permease [Desulfonema ishimotonii]
MPRLAILETPISALGRQFIFIIRELGRLGIFFSRGLIHIFSYPFQMAKLIEQLYFIGMKSVVVVCLTGAFTGMVLGFQGYYTLVKFGSEGVLGTIVSLTLIRELGPVLTAIMVTGRAGSAMAAELGIMRISEQIDALETMDINSVRFLFSPRLLAAVISLPLLTALFDAIGIFGGYLTGSVLLGISPGIYFYRTEYSVQMVDINGGFIKAFVFGIVVVTICCYQGYYTHLRKEGFGAKGVGSATTSAVVISCVLILATDYVLTSFLM